MARQVNLAEEEDDEREEEEATAAVRWADFSALPQSAQQLLLLFSFNIETRESSLRTLLSCVCGGGRGLIDELYERVAYSVKTIR